MIKSLPAKLSTLDRQQLREASDHRDARMTILFRAWSSLTKTELRELRHLNDERVRLARHAGVVDGLQRLRAPSLTS